MTGNLLLLLFKIRDRWLNRGRSPSSIRILVNFFSYFVLSYNLPASFFAIEGEGAKNPAGGRHPARSIGRIFRHTIPERRTALWMTIGS